jgi:hypothetical protein
MKMRTNLKAGYTSFEECDAERNFWKRAAESMEVCATTGKCSAYYPGGSGGIVNGVYFPDRSSYCTGGTTQPTKPPPSNGGWVGGVFYPDRSAYCTA